MNTLHLSSYAARAAAIAALAGLAGGLSGCIGSGPEVTTLESSAIVTHLPAGMTPKAAARAAQASFIGDEYRDAEQALLLKPAEPEVATF
jgi:hypothetical protein